MSPSPALRRAVEAAARLARLEADGERRRGRVVAVAATGQVEGTAPVLAIDVEVAGVAARVRVLQAVPIVLAARAVVGAEVDVLVAGSDAVVVAWSDR